jgi:TolB-like protein
MSGRLRLAIVTSLAKNRDERPASAAELRRVLTGAPAGPTTSRRRVGVLAAIAAAAVVAAVALGTYLVPLGSRSQVQTTAALSSQGDAGREVSQDRRTGIAVFEFRNERSDDRENDWIRSALQTTFSTELGKIRQVRVLSREIVEQSATKDSRPIELTRLLGAEKLITGSFAVIGKQIQIAARLVDARSGEQERAESVEGDVDQFFGLQKQLTLAMVNQLPIAVSASERAAIEKQNPSQNPSLAVDAYRLMLQGEGLDEGEGDEEDDGDQGARLDRSPSYAIAPAPAGETQRGFGVRSTWRGRSPLFAFSPAVAGATFNVSALFRLFMPSAALAQEQHSAEQEIRAILERYRQALEKGDLDGIQESWGKLTARRRKGLEEYFAIADDLRITFDRIEIRLVEDNRYAISYVRRDQFSDRRTGEQVDLEVQLVNTAERDGERWRIKNAKRLMSDE